MNLETARRHALRLERANKLFTQDGYELSQLWPEVNPDLYMVKTPKGDCYNVDLSGKVDTCTCEDFKRHGDLCKHTLGVKIELQRQEDEMYDAMAAHYCGERF